MAVPSPLSSRQTVAALLTLTAVTGLVDAVSYLRLGRVFVANMTGNVVFLGFSAGPRSGLSAAASIIAIAGFATGALAGGTALDDYWQTFVAVAWTLSFPGVTGAIAGARRPQQVEGWLPAAVLELKEDDLADIAAAIDATAAAAGPVSPPLAQGAEADDRSAE